MKSPLVRALEDMKYPVGKEAEKLSGDKQGDKEGNKEGGKQGDKGSGKQSGG